MQRPERLADLTMLSQTLKQVENIYWIVVEDGYYPKAIVKDLLDRSGIEYTYLATPHLGLPCRGWAQRNLALAFLRKNKNKFNKNDIIYFADDDNGYDLRLFDEYIRNVRKAGVWAVGIPGNALIEAPLVENGKVVAWHSAYKPERKFAIDMAGFALNFKLVTNSSAAWSLKCAGNFPENCFLNQLNLEREDLEPFGYESETKPVYVWHRKTAPANNEPFDLMGYQVEDRLPTNKQCKMYKNIHLMSYQQVKNVANKFGVKEYDYNELYGDV
ncbi:unnamed protein product [Bursaphelenchus okinawaensis]|uniref:Galactosylgalactosylxylosylprotein 3-beta-glucuronosyltransferase n=1 Tax=Bursaphelenchus okinawaensis TaxID=465554 RepID=A0A811KE28_9BILA|nr:unnamed protein product [Bursaphelenchus okinawaensis]CAG9099243.1 unnamed protein product [Bursaphelenchus okinawaensis]